MNQFERNQNLSAYMLSAEPQVRSELFENDYLFSDRLGVLTFTPLVFRAVGDIQNKLLSEKRTAMAAIEDNGVFSIWTGNFDTNGMPIGEKTLIFSSVQKLNNAAQIGPGKKPYSFGFAGNKLAIFALGDGGRNVGTLAETPSYTIGNSVKIKLMDSGALNIYIGEALYWSTIPIPGPTPQAQTTNTQNTNPTTMPANTTSLFSNPLVLIGGLFAAYKFFK